MHALFAALMQAVCCGVCSHQQLWPSAHCSLRTLCPAVPPARPQTVATEAHVRDALDLFKTSTMDAVKSGVMEMVVFSDEQR